MVVFFNLFRTGRSPPSLSDVWESSAGATNPTPGYSVLSKQSKIGNQMRLTLIRDTILDI
jgi:hypothetical protein